MEFISEYPAAVQGLQVSMIEPAGQSSSSPDLHFLTQEVQLESSADLRKVFAGH